MHSFFLYHCSKGIFLFFNMKRYTQSPYIEYWSVKSNFKSVFFCLFRYLKPIFFNFMKIIILCLSFLFSYFLIHTLLHVFDNLIWILALNLSDQFLMMTPALLRCALRQYFRQSKKYFLWSPHVFSVKIFNIIL